MTIRHTQAFKKKKKVFTVPVYFERNRIPYNYDLQTTEYLFCIESIIWVQLHLYVRRTLAAAPYALLYCSHL